MRKLLDPSLYYFSVVATTGSLSAATEKSGLTVSALSRHISKLESDLHTSLFDRHARGMELSYSGRMLLRYAQRSLKDAESVFREIQADHQQKAQTIKIACTEGFAFDFLPTSLSAFHVEHPGIKIELDVVSSEAANQRLLSGDVSIALVFSLSPQPDVMVQFTQNAPVMALMSNEHPLADRPALELADLVHYPILLQDKATTNRQLFDIACNVDGVEIMPAIISRYVGALYGFVQTLPGAILPSGYLAVAGRLHRDELVAVPFSNPLLTQRRLQIRTLAGREPDKLVRECIDHLSESLRRVSEPDSSVR